MKKILMLVALLGFVVGCGPEEHKPTTSSGGSAHPPASAPAPSGSAMK